jgi:hypothetical protein
MKREHVVMLAGKNLVTSLDDELKPPVVETIPGMIGDRGRLLQRRVCGDHLARHEILADAEVFQGTLGLSAPEFIGRNVDFAEAIRLFPNVASSRTHDHYLST